MNLGIIIGVSSYLKVHDLPGCKADANAVNELCNLTNKCNDILFITDNTESNSVKSKIAAFVKKYQDEQIDEVIFYFSGHGLFQDDEFFYVLTDYTPSKLRQTSLDNSELDNLLKSLSASVTIKIVDACQSGTRYVKDPDVLRKYLQNSESGFDKCYFFHSSQNDQSSYQTEEISDFTLGFLNAFIARPEQDIRYKDIMDSLSDEFSDNPKQTPFFVMQGNYTETFGFIGQDVVDALTRITKTAGDVEESKDSHKSLRQLVEEEAKFYCSKQEAFSCIQNVVELVKIFPFKNEITELFEIEMTKEVDSSFPVKTEHIGRSLSKDNIDYMANIIKENRVRSVLKANTGTFMQKLLAVQAVTHTRDLPTVQESYSVAISADSTVELPFKFLSIRLKAKYPNVNDTNCMIVPFISQTKMIIFSAFYTYKTQEWDVKQINHDSVTWINFEEFIKNTEETKINIATLLEEFCEFSIRPIKKTFNLLETDPIIES
ncbi:MAG: hypothetical protein OFPI_00190 [Osedax symbiont Rs2]|nr:MAG: hypothetical protein OFPI_00190 [Osedax symbiont Rs2]